MTCQHCTTQSQSEPRTQLQMLRVLALCFFLGVCTDSQETESLAAKRMKTKGLHKDNKTKKKKTNSIICNIFYKSTVCLLLQ